MSKSVSEGMKGERRNTETATVDAIPSDRECQLFARSKGRFLPEAEVRRFAEQTFNVGAPGGAQATCSPDG
jgi:hypothetical protein